GPGNEPLYPNTKASWPAIRAVYGAAVSSTSREPLALSNTGGCSKSAPPLTPWRVLVSTTPRPPRQRWLLCPHHPTAVPDDESSAALTALVKGAQSCCIFVSIDLAASIPLVKDLPGSQRFRAVAIPLRVTTWPGGATTHQPDSQDH